MVQETLEQIEILVADAATTVESLIAQLGKIQQDFGSNVWITPRDAAFSQINITRGVDQKSLHDISFSLQTPLPLAGFLERYPSATELVGEDDAPIQWVSTADFSDKPYLVRVLADTRLDEVSRITLMRDIRL
ncbi:MAG: hypothetical protein IAE89_14660 [Anaerolineae bacterium]|nr:hypothetical protein [Anaerolineae bacterium]